MKVWMLNHYGLPPKYHPISRTYNFGQCLLEDGYDVTIMTASTIHHTDVNLVEKGKKYKTENVDGLKYVYMRAPDYQGNGIKRILNMCGYYRSLKKNWKKFGRPDVIVASSVHLLTCMAGIQIARKVNCRCIVEIADLWPLTLIEFGRIKEKSILAKVLYKLEYWVYKNADELIFTFEGGRDYVRNKGWDKKVNPDKIHYINNGLILSRYEKQMEEKRLEDVHLDNPDLFKVVYTGSIGDANALEYLIEAAETAKNKGVPDMVFLLWGDGPNKKKFQDYCDEHGLDNVIFKGKVKKEMVAGILSRSDVNVLMGHPYPLYQYGISMNKLFDYMASGKPVVSNIKCGYDILERNQCGMTVDGKKENAIFEALMQFHDMSREEYDVWCNRAKEAVKEFDFHNLTKKLEKIIENG